MFGFLKPLLPPEPKEPLAPVLAPEAVGSSGRGKGHVLGRVLSESRRALDADPASFQRLTTREGWSVSCRPVEGTKLTMARLEADVSLRPDTLFKLLTETMDGKQIIDPFPRERHAEPVRLLRLRGGDARVVYTEMPRFAGMLRPREYVTCDAAAGREQLFVCKSVAVLEGPLAAAKKGKVRANLLFAFRTQPRKDGRPGCHVQMVNWLDLGANTVPTGLANFITERWYFQSVMKRLNRYTAQHRLTVDTPPSALERDLPGLGH